MAPVLAQWKPDCQIIVETDASNYALAAILSIQDTDGEVHPVAFKSRTFTRSELNYNVHDKELLAIYEAFKSWHHYLEGSTFPVDVITTKTWNILLPQKSSPNDKPVGPNIYQISILLLYFDQDASAPSLMP